VSFEATRAALRRRCQRERLECLGDDIGSTRAVALVGGCSRGRGATAAVRRPATTFRAWRGRLSPRRSGRFTASDRIWAFRDQGDDPGRRHGHDRRAWRRRKLRRDGARRCGRTSLSDRRGAGALGDVRCLRARVRAAAPRASERRAGGDRVPRGRGADVERAVVGGALRPHGPARSAQAGRARSRLRAVPMLRRSCR
jgi:hypothetical protein